MSDRFPIFAPARPLLRFSGNRSVVLPAILVVMLLVAACGGDADVASSAPATATQAPAGASQSTIAPAPSTDDVVARRTPMFELEGIAGWINSEPLTITELINDNKVVLIDFWTYTCVNCLRTLPFLRDWHQKYSDRGLVILGVHSPEFEFEKDIENVRQAVEDDGVLWPVALDSDMATWDAFGNRFWPAKYLISTEGSIDYTHFGEGAYVETEEELRAALTAAGHDVSDIPIGTVSNIPRDREATRITRELYGGYERNYNPQGLYAGDEQYYIAPDTTLLYEDDRNYTPQQWFLHGLWTNGPEAIIHARETEEPEDYLAMNFIARSVNVVIQPQGPEPFEVFLYIDDDQPLAPDEAGEDVIFNDEGQSLIIVDEARMYRIVEQPTFLARDLKLSSTSDNFAIFAFTFGIYDSGF